MLALALALACYESNLVFGSNVQKATLSVRMDVKNLLHKKKLIQNLVLQKELQDKLDGAPCVALFGRAS